MNINIKIDTKQLQQQITKEIQGKVTQAIPQIKRALDQRLENLLFQRFISGVPPFSTREIGEIGVPDLNQRIQSIIREASRSFEIEVIPANLLKINMKILRKDHQDLLDLPESVFAYTSRNGSGILTYLKWLLIDGDQIIVNDFTFSPTNRVGSRTQQGIMVSGSGWRMPQEIAGTAGNNILTRSLQNLEKDLEMIVKQELNRLIK